MVISINQCLLLIVHDWEFKIIAKSSYCRTHSPRHSPHMPRWRARSSTTNHYFLLLLLFLSVTFYF